MCVCTQFVFPTSYISHKKDKIYVAWLHGNNHFEASLLLLLLFLNGFDRVYICALYAMGYYILSWMRIYEKGQIEKAILCKCFAETNDLTCSTPSFNNTFCYKSVRMMKTLYFRTYFSKLGSHYAVEKLTNLLSLQWC